MKEKICRDGVACVVLVWPCPACKLPFLHLVSVVLALPSLHPSTVLEDAFFNALFIVH